MRALFIASCLYICAQDFRKQIISHRSLAIFTPLSLFHLAPASISTVTMAFASLLALTLASDIGGGDIKLIAILIATQGDVWLRVESISIVLFASFAVFSVLMFKGGEMTSRVPLAPVILAPVAIFYLAI
jgi:Flp pilus assembly protein protease CpaA